MRLFLLTAFIVVGVADQAEATPIRSPLKGPSTSSIRKVLSSGGWFTVSENAYRFARDGTMKASGIYAASGKGRYSVDGTTISGSGHGRLMMHCESKQPDRDCPWSFEMEWEVLQVAGDALVIRVINDPAEQIQPPEEPVLVICRDDKHRSKDQPARKQCAAASYDGDTSMVLIPGNKDGALYERARAFIEGWDGKIDRNRFWVFDGKRPKNQRAESEIWYRDGSERDARALAKKLESELGAIEPQPWAWDGHFDIFVIVGASRSGESPVRVALMDGHCVDKKDCKSPVYDAIRKALPPSRYPRVKEGLAKKPRTATEVWFREGREAAARQMVEEHLSDWVVAENIKKWTWGGDFDVMIVAGPPK
jgi:hypothetical protein